MSLTILQSFRYKLPLTLTDSSTSLDAVAFNKIAEDLVERHADHVSMSMKIEATDHVLTLDKAIGKEKLFYIVINTDSSAKYPITYVLKKSFSVNNTESTPVPHAPKVTNFLQIHYLHISWLLT